MPSPLPHADPHSSSRWAPCSPCQSSSPIGHSPCLIRFAFALPCSQSIIRAHCCPYYSPDTRSLISFWFCMFLPRSTFFRSTRAPRASPPRPMLSSLPPSLHGQRPYLVPARRITGASPTFRSGTCFYSPVPPFEPYLLLSHDLVRSASVRIVPRSSFAMHLLAAGSWPHVHVVDLCLLILVRVRPFLQ